MSAASRLLRSARAALPIVVASIVLSPIGGAVALAQTQPARIVRPATPIRPVAPAQDPNAVPASGAPDAAQSAPTGTASEVSDTERARLRALHAALDADGQAEMETYYDAMGIDLLALIRAASAAGEVVPPRPPLAPMLRRKDFKRTPQAVLSARTALGLERTVRPEESAEPTELVDWLHTQTMAGEWDELEWFLAERAGDEAEAIYSQILQATNQGDPLLLPEEVLALADAAPGAPTAWQIETLASLLRGASERTSRGPLLTRLRAGTRLFGGEDPEHRARTANLLARAGMAREAFEFLPPIADARRDGDADALLVHGLYHAGLAKAVRDGSAEVERRRAWDLFSEIALIDDAEMDLRRQALREAIGLVPEVPESVAAPWLERVFADARIAPAALEIVALDALTLRDRGLDEADRVRGIVTMQTAVQTLLDAGEVDRDALRVPLRMLTTGLVQEAEKALGERRNPRAAPPENAMLLRAVPDEAWLATIEPSLSVRAYRAFTGVAVLTDEIDVALDILEKGVDRHPDQASVMADEFLASWIKRLRPDAGSNMDAAQRAFFMAYGGRFGMPSAPLTRGRQARNLDRLMRVLALVREIEIDPRSLDGVVGAFRACHSASEAFTEADIERVLGPVDELPASTAAELATAMRGGLSGDWRSREVQQRFGMRRNASEIAEVVEEGYALAMQLIDRAIELEPDSWDHAMNKAALAFDRLEHRRSLGEGDEATFAELRRQSFDAFDDAAGRYGESLVAGRVKASPQVHLLWFNAAIGATDAAAINRDNVMIEGSDRDDQIDRIGASIDRMPAELAGEQRGLFAQAIAGGVSGLNPEVKPRVVRHALRVVGDHPLGASLRRIAALYDDLVRDEIRLRLAIDGSDRVGTDRDFAVVLSLRYTNSVDRETDGFAKYLQNEVWVNMGNRGTFVNYRDRLQRSIESSLGDAFAVETIGFFDPLNPSREVREDGETSWQEKPLAYAVLRARDASVDRVPPVRMDLDFVDSTGPVILTVQSNAPPIDATTFQTRPLRELRVEQIVDARSIDSGTTSGSSGDDDGAVVLEVTARGRGLIPELEELLAGVDDALEGASLADGDIEAHPVNLVELGSATSGRGFMMPSGDEDDATAYAVPDEDGTWRLETERSWTVRYRPSAAGIARAFTLPSLLASLDGSLDSRYFDDFDLVAATGATVPIDGGGSMLPVFLSLGVVAVALAVVWISLRRKGNEALAAAADLVTAPEHATPLGTIAVLRRIDDAYGERLGVERRDRLAEEIGRIEAEWFGPGTHGDVAAAETSLRPVVDRWLAEARG